MATRLTMKITQDFKMVPFFIHFVQAGVAFGTEMEEEYNVKSPTRNTQESSTSKEPSRSEINIFDVLMKSRSQKVNRLYFTYSPVCVHRL